MSSTLDVPSGHTLSLLGHTLSLLPAGGGVALVMRDPQRGLLSSCSASPWEWGGCALWEGKAGTSEGCKSKNTTARDGNGLARLGETKDLGVQQHPKSLFQEMNMVLCCPAMASAPPAMKHVSMFHHPNGGRMVSRETLLCSVLSANLQFIGVCISFFHPPAPDPSPALPWPPG